MVIYYQSNNLLLEYCEGTYFFYATNALIARKYTALSASKEFLKYKEDGKVPILLIRDLIILVNQVIVLGVVLFLYIGFLVITTGSTVFIALAIIVVCAIYEFSNYAIDIENKLRK